MRHVEHLIEPSQNQNEETLTCLAQASHLEHMSEMNHEDNECSWACLSLSKVGLKQTKLESQLQFARGTHLSSSHKRLEQDK